MIITGVIQAGKRAVAVGAGKAGAAVAAPKAAIRAKAGVPVGKVAAPAGKAAATAVAVPEVVGRAAAPAVAAPVGKSGGAVKSAAVAPGKTAAASGKAAAAPGRKAGAAGVMGAVAVGAGAVGVVEGVMTAAPAAKKSAADVMESDKGFQAVKANAKHDAVKARTHEGGAKKAGDAQSAAKGPANETMSKAKDKQSDAMDQQEPGAFDQEHFKAALRAKIDSLKMDTLKDADEFKKNDGAAAVKGDMAESVNSEKTAAAGGVTDKVKEQPDAGKEQPKEVGPEPVVSPGVATTPVSGAAAAPKPVQDADISLQKGSQDLDHQMTDAKVTDKQLTKANEPGFTQAVQSKNVAQKDSVDQPVQFRKTEKGLVGQAQTAAAGTAHAHLGSMVAGRNKHMGGVLEKQNATKAKDEENRKKVSDTINQKFDAAKKEVEDILAKLDTDAKKNFDDGIAEATRQFEDFVDKGVEAFKDDRYSGVTGKARWGWDLLAGLPDDVNKIYVKGKALYVSIMDGVIDRVAKIVADGLNAAKKRINAGKQEIKTYVDSLPKDLQKLGQDAAKEMNSKFTELENSVNDKEGELVDALAQKYKAGMEAVDKRIDEMKEANKGLIDKAKAFISDVINTILALKNMLLNVLARAASAIGLIIEDPIGFLGNLVAGVKKGIKNFLSNILSHLKEGLLGWLFGAIAEAGIEIPKSFDLKGILSLILQVLGMTYKNIRARAVNLLGEKVVGIMEKVADIFLVIKNEGIGGLWRFIVEQVTKLKDTVMDSIKDFVITKIITAGITWLISLLNPASAFIKACKMIYDVVMFFVERGKQIISLVNAVIDSVTAIAKGAIDVAANAVEAALAKALPVAISFLASLLGLDGISEKIKNIIAKIQEPINKVIDWVITKAMGLLKAAGKLLGIGKDGKGDDADSKKVKKDVASKLSERLGAETDQERANSVVAQTFNEFKPFGLKALALRKLADGSGYGVYAVASPEQEVLKLKADARALGAERPSVVCKVTIGLVAKVDPHQAADLDIVDADDGHGGKQRMVSGGGMNWEAPRNTGTTTRRNKAMNNQDYAMMSTLAPRQGGAVVIPKGKSDTVEAHTWNTGPKISLNKDKTSNDSHAERQFINWYKERSDTWKAMVRRIDITLSTCPCDNYCSPDLKNFRDRIEADGVVTTSLKCLTDYKDPSGNYGKSTVGETEKAEAERKENREKLKVAKENI
jgi:hypothetical protein